MLDQHAAVAFALLVSQGWLWFALSVLITAVHTADEVRSAGGPIWDYLAPINGLSAEVVAIAYGAFQGGLIAVAYLAFVAGGDYRVLAVVALIAARVLDFALTHTLLPADPEYRPNPGHTTRWLLLCDPVFWCWFV